MEVGDRTLPSFAVTAPTVRFSLAGLDINFYDVEPGGKHFAFVTRLSTAGNVQAPSMILVVNWLDDFKRVMQARH